MSVAPLPETDDIGAPVLSIRPSSALYLGPSLRLAPHTTSVHCVVVGVDGPFCLHTEGRPDIETRSALVRPRRRHQVTTAPGTTMLFAYLDVTASASRHLRSALLAQPSDLRITRQHEQHLINLGAAGRCEAIHRALLEARSTGAPVDERITEAIEYLAAHPTAGAADVARRVATSTSHFLHVFAAETATSFRRYRLWLRMLRVAAAVIEGANLTEASAAARFASPSHLSDSFSDMFGLTPSALLATGARIEIDPTPL